MQTQTHLVDAFACGSLQGNPAAVVLSDHAFSPNEMALKAKQLGQPAHAFLWHPNIFSVDFAQHHTDPYPVLRWFSAKGEPMPLCGHATIAATLYLFRTFPTLSTVTYDTPKGPLIANSLADGYVEAGLSISARPTSLDSSEAVEHQKLVAAACGVPFSAIIDFQTAQSNDISKSNLLVVLDPNIYLQALKVDPNELGKLPYRGFYLTQRFSKPHPKYSFKSRVFFPSVGIPEDQVCGSAHTLLAPYWAERQNISTHFSEPLLGLQVSQQGGEVGCRWESWQPGAVAFLIGTGRIRESVEEVAAPSIPGPL